MSNAVTRGVLSVMRRSSRQAGATPDALAMLAALAVPVALFDVENRFRYANQAAEQFFGISTPQLVQMQLSDLLPEDSPIFSLIGTARERELTVADHSLTLESPRITKRNISVQASPVPEEPGSVLVALIDSGKVRSLGQQMQVRSAARSVTGMAAMLAHEVKNPLSGIRGAAQLLEASVAPADRELAVLIRDEADRIRALVDRMEIFGEKPVEMRAVNIHRVLEHVRKLALTGFAPGMRISENYDPSLPPVWGNRDQLVQVMLNLVKNSAEALIDAQVLAPEITMTTAYEHGVRLGVPGSPSRLHLPLLVAVRDNGPGIPEDLQPHLFDPFVTSKSTGSGLGLALVAKIIGDHGGMITVDSRPGRTEFRLHLPVVSEDAGEFEIS